MNMFKNGRFRASKKDRINKQNQKANFKGNEVNQNINIDNTAIINHLLEIKADVAVIKEKTKEYDKTIKKLEKHQKETYFNLKGISDSLHHKGDH